MPDLRERLKQYIAKIEEQTAPGSDLFLEEIAALDSVKEDLQGLLYQDEVPFTVAVTHHFDTAPESGTDFLDTAKVREVNPDLADLLESGRKEGIGENFGMSWTEYDEKVRFQCEGEEPAHHSLTLYFN